MRRSLHKRWVRSRLRSDEGEVLVLVLIIMLVFSITIGVFLNQIDSGFNLSRATNTQSDMLYATDAGVEWGIGQVTNNQGLCNYQNNNLGGAGITLTGNPNPAQQLQVPPDVTSLNVTCQQVSSSGSNTFGGYAVVAGVNSHGQIANTPPNPPNPSCVSLSADPVGGGSATRAQEVVAGSKSCLSYQGQAGPVPQWTAQPGPDTATTLNGVFGLGGGDFWAGGANGPNAVVWHSDGDEWSDVSGIAPNGLPNGSNGSIGKLWAAPDPNTAGQLDAWAAGSFNNRATVWFSADSDTAATPTWTQQLGNVASPTGFTDISGFQVGTTFQLFAVGSSGTVVYASPNGGTSWASTQLATGVNPASAVNGVFALDATHAWAVGTSGGVGTVWFSADGGTTWDAGTKIAGTTTLSNVRASDPLDVWVAGTAGAQPVVAFNNGTAWTGTTAISGAHTESGIYTADATDIWVVGTSTAAGNPGTVWYCNGATNCSNGTSPNGWTTTGETVPAGTVALNDISGFDAQPGDVYAVGRNGTLLEYNPSSETSCTSGGVNQCLAEILGGPVFNGNALNLQSGLFQRDGNFTQYSTTAACPATPVPTGLVIAGTNQYCTANSVPNSVNPTVPAASGGLHEPLPTSVPLASSTNGGPTVVPGTPSGCTLNVYAPGKYTTKVTLAKNTTNFFESGVYYFTAGFGGLDNGNTGTDNLYVIGGQPGPGDVNQISQNSPCWNFLTTTPYYTAGSGTGVEWIIGANTWFDVHSVHLELFTRQGGPASEGAQGISLREVPPVCSGADTSAGYDTTVCVPTGTWTPSAPPNPGQIFQVDANNHSPNVYLHGGIFMPNNNLEEFTSSAFQVTLGAVFANSIEFSYQNATVAPLQISAGAPNFTPTTVLTATAVGSAGQTFQVQSVVETDISPTTGLVTKVQEKSWRIVRPAS